MQKHIYLSVFLGLVFNTLFFAQNEIIVEEETETTEEGLTEVTIERIVIDEDGNETKYVIKKKGAEADVFADHKELKQKMQRDFDFDIDIDDEGNVERRVIKIRGDKGDGRSVWVHEIDDKPKPKVLMGVNLENNNEGVAITYVTGNSAAQTAGLLPGDVITALDGQTISTHKELTEVLMNKEVGDNLNVQYIREGQAQNTDLELKSNPRHEESEYFDSGCGYVQKPCLGVWFNSWNEGIKITGVFEESGAEFSGLQEGDKIVSIDGEKYTFSSQFDRMIKAQEPGATMNITFEREGETMTTDAEVGVWDACGVCRLISEDVEEVIKNNEVVLETDLQLNSFEMYPVPARQDITVSFTAEPGPIEVSFYDVTGKLIDQVLREDFDGRFERTYQLDDVAKGLAVFTITQNGKSVTKQAIIQ